MSRNSVICFSLALLICAFALSGSSLISDEKLKSESAAQYKLAEVKRSELIKKTERAADIYYPRTAALKVEDDGARFVGAQARAERAVQAGDVLASYRIEESNAERTRLVNERARLLEKIERDRDQLKIDDTALVKAIAETDDPIQRESLTIEREIRALEAERSAIENDYRISTHDRQIEKIDERLKEQVLTAPFDGVVRNVTTRRAGDSLYHTETLVNLYALDPYLLRIEDTLGQVRYNMPVTIAIGPRNDRTYLTGRVVAADNVLPFDLKSGIACIAFDEPPEDSKGMIFPQVEVKLIELYNVLTTSRKALTLEKGAQYVSILDQDKVKKRIINATLSGVDDCLILGGLSEGDQLIVK